MATTELDAGQYYYAEYGDPGAAPLVLLQFADALGLDRFVLAGHSMGGTVATLFAERYPDRLTGLILIDSPPPDGSGTWDPGRRPDGDLPYDWAVKPAIFAQLNHPDPAW
jgi:pimeloyl-ACP methyl ester carboxylesterase